MSWWREPGNVVVTRRQRLVPLVLLAACGLSACGFQLRGDFRIPDALMPIYIDAGRGSNVAAELKEQLRRNNAAIAAERSDAASVIAILSEKQRRRVLTVSAASAEVDEYELQLTTRWLLRDGGEDDRPLTNLETVEILRDYTYDRGAVLAKQSEEADLVDRMKQDTALRILYRIQAWQPDQVPEPVDVEAQLEAESGD